MNILLSYICSLNRLDLNLPDFGSVILGITDIRRQSMNNINEEDIPIEITHTYDFNCSCHKCNSNNCTDGDFGEKLFLKCIKFNK